MKIIFYICNSNIIEFKMPKDIQSYIKKKPLLINWFERVKNVNKAVKDFANNTISSKEFNTILKESGFRIVSFDDEGDLITFEDENE